VTAYMIQILLPNWIWCAVALITGLTGVYLVRRSQLK
jgi:bacteriorhodopsin